MGYLPICLPYPPWGIHHLPYALYCTSLGIPPGVPLSYVLSVWYRVWYSAGRRGPGLSPVINMVKEAPESLQPSKGVRDVISFCAELLRSPRDKQMKDRIDGGSFPYESPMLGRCAHSRVSLPAIRSLGECGTTKRVLSSVS